MASEKAIALVLYSVDFSETSSVLTLFTREFGKVRGLAKGARRLKGPFESALDLLAVCRIVFLRKSSEALNLVIEAKLERRFRPGKGDLSALYAAYYIAELLNELTDDFDPHPELFDAADRALAALGGAGESASLTLQFELTILRLLGHLPAWKDCVECGRAVDLAGRTPFGQLAGGVLCAKCRAGHKQVVSISPDALRLLADWSTPLEFDETAAAPASGTLGEAGAIVRRYLSHLIGHPPRLHRYLKAGP